MWICVYAYVWEYLQRPERLWIPLRLELQVAVNLPICVLRLKSSRRALSRLNLLVISKVPPNRIFETLLLKLVSQWPILKKKIIVDTMSPSCVEIRPGEVSVTTACR